MANYAKALPTDVNQQTMQEYPPPYQALTAWQNNNASISSVINLNPNTQALEISSFGGQGLVIRWIKASETAAVSPFASVISSGTSANFDHYVPAGVRRRFIVPRDQVLGQAAGGQIGSVNGLIQRLAWMNAGATASSIIANEY